MQNADTSSIVACQRPRVGACLSVDVDFGAFGEGSLALMDTRMVVFDKGLGTRFGRTAAFEFMVRRVAKTSKISNHFSRFWFCRNKLSHETELYCQGRSHKSQAFFSIRQGAGDARTLHGRVYDGETKTTYR